MQKRPIYSRWLLLLILTSPQFVVAAMFEAEFDVANRTTEARNEAIRAGLEEVLVRVSGYGLVASEPLVAKQLQQAQRYVQRYHYQPLEEQPVRPVAPMSAEELEAFNKLPRFRLWVIYDEVAVKRLLHDVNLMVWREPRPKILVWLAVEDGGKRQLVGANDRGVALELLQQASRRRGLPIELPLLDLEDRQAVKVGDIWHGFTGSVLRGSQRYTPNAVLIGKLFPATDGSWQTDWVLLQGTERFGWQGGGEDVALLLQGGVGGAADSLSLLYAERFESGAAQRLLLFDGVSRFSAMRQLLDYLEGLEGISSLQVVERSGERLLIELNAEGGMEMILDTLDKGGVVTPVVEPLIAPLPELAQPSGQEMDEGESGELSEESEERAVVPLPAKAVAIRHYRLVP